MIKPPISNIILNNYRNYEVLSLTFSRSCLFYGPNGCGKTNILEAISLFNLKQGFRNANLEHLIKYGCNKAHALLTFNHNNLGTMNLEVEILNEGQENYKKNYLLDNSIIKPKEAHAYFPDIISLIPQMDNFFIQDSSFKRKFIDKLIATIDKKHNSRLNEHELLVKERNKVLYMNNSVWLNKLEEQISSLSSSIVALRLDFIKQLNIILKNNSLHPLELSFSGIVEDWYQEHKYSTIVENHLKNHLFANRESDAQKGSTSQGAHRSKLKAISHIKNSSAELCSTGEQKIMLVNILLAFYQLLLNYKHIKPILLLDEINVHLDKVILEQLLTSLLSLNTQLFITATNCDFYHKFTSALQFVNLEDIAK